MIRLKDKPLNGFPDQVLLVLLVRSPLASRQAKREMLAKTRRTCRLFGISFYFFKNGLRFCLGIILRSIFFNEKQFC